MFVFGHVLTTMDSNIFRDIDLEAGEGVIGLMMPDMLSSHDWGYENCWNVKSISMDTKLIQAHMIGDAVVHYGSRWNKPLTRKGWAYKNMGVIAKEYHQFFDNAKEAGFLIDETKPRDSIRGWAHSLVEYSIDQYLTDTRNLVVPFESIRREFRKLENNIEEVNTSIQNIGIIPSKPYPSQPLRYSGVISRSEEPDEFHLRGLASKFGLVESPEVLNWTRSILRRIIQDLGKDDLENVISEITKVVNNPNPFGYPLPYLSWLETQGNHNKQH
ncbi:TPA: hypothetical protein QCY03_003484 [Bacillus tropicus]|nr:hypothetical protein [Bacillus tropicus]